MGYPCWRYSATGAVRVTSAEEEADLGPGWVDSPKKVRAKDVIPADDPMTAIPPKRARGRKTDA